MAGKFIGSLSDEELHKTLLVIYSMVGLREHHYPTPEDDVILFAFIRAEYRLKTREELILAFKLAITDELDLPGKDGDGAKVYDQFTCEYVARIMTAYRKWLKDKNQKVMAEPKSLPPAGDIEISHEEKFYDIQELKLDPNRKMPLIAPYFYDWLTEFGYLRHSAGEKKRLLGEALEWREGELKHLAELDITGQRGDKTRLIKFQSLMANGFPKDSVEFRTLVTLSKQIGVFEWLESLTPAPSQKEK